MIVAAHQPAYLPWLGYFHKIARSDLFVVMDDLQYEAQNFQNRNRVKVNNGTTWLTVPLVHGSQTDRICDKRISNHATQQREHWQRRTWKTLTTHYRRTPYFRDYADELEAIYTRAWTDLVELDLRLTQLCMRWLDIARPILRSSSLGLSGQRTARIVDLCQKVNAEVYLSGSGGSSDYLEVEQFLQAGIEVTWQKFIHPAYQQRYPALGFVSHLSVLDLLFNCGPESHDILFGDDLAEGLSIRETGKLPAAATVRRRQHNGGVP